MFGSQTIEVVLGLVFIYLLLSIICTAANELVAGLFKLRARNLLHGIENLLRHQGIDGLVDRFYSHPLIRSLSNGEKKPSYIPSRAFALALVDLIGQSKTKSNPFTFEKIHAAVTSNLPEDSDLRKVMQIFLDDAGRDAGKVLTSVETWFNASMERVAGWYKRKLQILVMQAQEHL